MVGTWKCSRKLFGKGEPPHDSVGHAPAAPASKWKRVHENGTDLLVQFLAHEPPRPMQPRFYRLRLKTKKVRGFLDAHPIDHARHEHDSKDLGQIVGRALDKLQNFALCYGSFRIGGRHRVREFDNLRLSLL